MVILIIWGHIDTKNLELVADRPPSHLRLCLRSNHGRCFCGYLPIGCCPIVNRRTPRAVNPSKSSTTSSSVQQENPHFGLRRAGSQASPQPPSRPPVPTGPRSEALVPTCLGNRSAHIKVAFSGKRELVVELDVLRKNGAMYSVQDIVYGDEGAIATGGEDNERPVGNGGCANDDGAQGGKSGGLVHPVSSSVIVAVVRRLATSRASIYTLEGGHGRCAHVPVQCGTAWTSREGIAQYQITFLIRIRNERRERDGSVWRLGVDERRW